MAEFFAELKRRQMFRVAAAYAVVAWLLLQIVNNIAPGLNLPNWAITLVIVLLAVGFPIALLFCWIQHLPDSSGQATKTARVDWLLVGALGLVIALLAYQQIASPPVARAPDQSASSAPATLPGSISIAVLPFANVSADSSQEYFSDGMTDEITTALAKIQGLRVVGRTSAFQFKGERKDLRAIGQSLGATHLIEGSVRNVGDRVRITAQLVQAANGLNMWTDAYDREMTDVFAIQEEIATAIAGALRVPLGLQQGETLVRDRTTDVESYQQYLRAKSLYRTRGLTRLTEAAALLEHFVTRDPNYAPAWALLALVSGLIPDYHPAFHNGSSEELRRVVEASFPRAETAAQRAIQLDPSESNGYLALGVVQHFRGKLLLAEELYSKALALDPDNPDALHNYSLLLAGVARLKEALAIRQRLQALEPFVPPFNWNTALVLWLNGQTDAAIEILTNLPQDSAGGQDILALIYAAAGRYGEAADALQEIPSGTYPTAIIETATRLLRTAPAPAASPQALPLLGGLGFVYRHVGASNRVLDFFERNVEAGYALAIADTTRVWHPSYTAERKTERFKTFVRNAGMVDYWRARGWPYLCHPTTGDDFVCD